MIHIGQRENGAVLRRVGSDYDRGSFSTFDTGDLRELGMAKVNKLIAEVVERLRPIMKFDPIEDRTSYTIGQLSTHLRVSLRTLRFYEQSGLLTPDREGLRRLYSRDDLDRLEVIVTLRELEVALTSIKALMTAIDDGEVAVGSKKGVMSLVEGILGDLAGENLARIEELEQINARIADARRNLVAE